MVTQEQITKAMFSGAQGCQLMLDAGMRDTEIVFAGGLTNFINTLRQAKQDKLTLHDLHEALLQYAIRRQN